MIRQVLTSVAATLLLTPFAAGAQPPPPATVQPIEKVYDKMCRNCHGADGKAETKMGRKHGIDSFADVAWQKGHSDAEIAEVILNGVPDTKMKAYRTKLTREQVDQMVAYVRHFDPRRSQAGGGGTPPAPAKSTGAGQPPAPAKATGSAAQPPAPAKATGSAAQPPAPAKGTGSAAQPPAPAKGTGSAAQPPAPAKGTGSAAQPPAPAAL